MRILQIQKHILLDDDEVLEKSLLPQDYIERQRAYFAEIDACDLAEEVVSESELEQGCRLSPLFPQDMCRLLTKGMSCIAIHITYMQLVVS